MVGNGVPMRGDPGAGGPSPHPADGARAAARIASILAPPHDAGRAARVRRAKKFVPESVPYPHLCAKMHRTAGNGAQRAL
jgi:hypothetical protein